MHTAILGAGAWGTALAVHAARHPAARPGASPGADAPRVRLWARDPAQVRALCEDRTNARYLPGIALPPALEVVAELDATVDEALAAGGLIVVATPMSGLQPMLEHLARRAAASALAPGRARVAWLCKGLQQDTALLGHELAERACPDWPFAVLSGPTFALELARGQPTAMVCASRDTALARAAVDALHHGPMRLYTSDDPVGVEVGGAVKNVMAIAVGIADGLPAAAWPGIEPAALPPAAPSPADPPTGLGLNARAALITRGLAEMTRLGVRMGARPETFMGLSGLGDLVLTATGSLSRNRRVGLELASGRSLEAILTDLGHVAEGVRCAPAVLDRSRRLGVSMPITEAVVEVLQGRSRPADAVARLLAREAKAESL